MSVHSDTTDVKRMDEQEPDGNEEEVDEEENWDDQASKTVMKGLVEKALKGYKAEIVCHALEEATGKVIKKKMPRYVYLCSSESKDGSQKHS